MSVVSEERYLKVSQDRLGGTCILGEMIMLTYDLDALQKVKGFLEVVSLDELGLFKPTDLTTDRAFWIDPFGFGAHVLAGAKPEDFGKPLALAEFSAGEVTDRELFARVETLSGDPCADDATQMCRIVLQMGRLQAHGEQGFLETHPRVKADDYPVNRFYMPGCSHVVWMKWQVGRTLVQHEPKRYWSVRTSSFDVHRYATGDRWFVPLIAR